MKKDSGFAWVVMIASSVAHMLSLGFGLPIQGTLVPELNERFKVSLTESSWVGAVHIGILFMFSPLSSMFVKLSSPRTVQVTGSICMGVGTATCFFATNLWHVHLAFGVLAGIGVSLCYTSSSEILAHHFEKYMYLVAAVVILGSFIGFSITPILSQLLFDKCGFNLAMLIMAAAQIFNCIAGLLYLIPEISLPLGEGQAAENSTYTPGAINHDVPSIATGEQTSQQSIGETKLSDKDGSNDESNCKGRRDDANTADPGPQNVIDTLKQLACSFTAWSFVICGFLYALGSIAFFALILDYSHNEVGMTKQEAALGSTIIGIAAIPGSVLVCAKSRVKYDRVILHAASIFTYGSCAIISAFSNGKVYYYVTMSVFGIGYGVQISNLLAVAYDICGPRQMVILFGLELLFEGAGSLTGPPLCSYIGETIGSKNSIIISGLFIIIAALVLIPIIIIRYRDQRKPTHSTDLPLTSSL